jgi:predicted transcriptional regulator
MPGGPLVQSWKRTRIIKMHEDTDLTQYEIADLMQVRQSTVSKIITQYRKEVSLRSQETRKPQIFNMETQNARN